MKSNFCSREAVDRKISCFLSPKIFRNEIVETIAILNFSLSNESGHGNVQVQANGRKR